MQQYSHPTSLFIFGIVVTFLFTEECLAQEKIDWKERFFAEAPKRWVDYLHFAHSLQVTETANRFQGADRSPMISVCTQYKQTKGASMYVSYREFFGPNKSEAVAEGFNPSYSFKLKRPNPHSGWVITQLNVLGQTSTFSDEQRQLQESLLQDVCDCLRLDNLWLPTLIHDQAFKITAVKPQEIDGLPVVRFDFDYPKPDKDYPHKGAMHIKGGWMVIDPEHDWILRDYLVHTSRPENYFIRKTFQIRQGTNNHPIITHFTSEVVSKGEKPFESIGKGEWETVEQSDVPLEEFTLSAFGLPEPPGTQAHGSRLHLWIALVGIVCLGIAALIRWQIRRTRTVG
jgi:hypothetical protein